MADATTTGNLQVLYLEEQIAELRRKLSDEQFTVARQAKLIDELKAQLKQ